MKAGRMSEVGPVEYMIVAFPGNRFTGEIAPALQELVDSETIRIIDLAFVSKDAEGEVVGFELSDLDDEVQAALEKAGAEATGLFNEEDLMAAAEELESNSSAALWSGRTCGRRGSRTRSATPVARSTTSDASPMK